MIVTPILRLRLLMLISRIIKVQDTRCLKLAISYTRLIICKVACNCKHIYTCLFLIRRFYHLFNPKNQCYHRRSEVFSNKRSARQQSELSGFFRPCTTMCDLLIWGHVFAFVSFESENLSLELSDKD